MCKKEGALRTPRSLGCFPPYSEGGVIGLGLVGLPIVSGDSMADAAQKIVKLVACGAIQTNTCF